MSDNQPDNLEMKRAGRRRWWIAAGTLAALAVVLVCAVTLVAVAGVLVAGRLAGNPVTALPASPDAVRDDTAGAPPLPGRLALVTSGGALSTVNPDGSDVRLLGEPGVRYQFPAWSAGGTRLAALANDGSQAAVQVLADSADAAPVELYGNTINPPFYLYWSPDDSQVSFLANDRSGIALWLAPADGGQPARKIGEGQPFYWDWTADSQQLLVHIGGLGAESRLGFIDTEGNEVGNDLPEPGLFQAPGIAAGGRYVAFSQVAGEQIEIAVQDTATGGQSTVRQLGLAAMTWSPAGDQLAFISPARRRLTFAGPLQVLDPASGDTRTLVNRQVGAFFWSPDGQRIAILTADNGNSDPGAGLPPEFTANGPSPRQQTPDVLLSLSVVEVASGQMHTLASFRPSDVFVSQFLPYFDQYALSHRIWSPDGRALVVPMLNDRGEAGIYVVSLDGGPPQRIADGVMAFWSR